MTSSDDPQLVLSLEGVGKTFRPSGRLGGPNRRREAVGQDDEDSDATLGGVVGLELDDDVEDDVEDEVDDFDPLEGPPRTLQALEDVSFAVATGETVGVIGTSGAGKTTLLRLIARTLPLSTGLIRAREPISPPLQTLASALEGDLTGAQNVVVLADLLGERRDVLMGRLEEIAHVAGLQDHIHLAVTRWPSGFSARLAASTVFAMRPALLLSEGPPAVGDPAFREVCLARVAALRGEGTGVLMTAANGRGLRTHCDRGVWLEAGRVRMVGSAADVADAFDAEHGPGESIEKLERARERQAARQLAAEARAAAKDDRARHRLLRRRPPVEAEAAPPPVLRVEALAAAGGTEDGADTITVSIELTAAASGDLSCRVRLATPHGKRIAMGPMLEHHLDSRCRLSARATIPADVIAGPGYELIARAQLASPTGRHDARAAVPLTISGAADGTHPRASDLRALHWDVVTSDLPDPPGSAE